MILFMSWLGVRCLLRCCPSHIVRFGEEDWVTCALCSKRHFRIWPRGEGR